MHRVERIVYQGLRIVACLLLVALCSAMALQVFQRFVVGRSLDWPDELAPTLLGWISFVGAALAARENEHIGFPMLLEKLPPRASAIVHLAGTAIVVALLGVYVWFSVPLILRTWNQLMTTVPVSRGLIYLVLPLTALIISGYALRNSPLGAWLRRRSSREPAAAAGIVE